jgi:hypothetical protein
MLDHEVIPVPQSRILPSNIKGSSMKTTTQRLIQTAIAMLLTLGGFARMTRCAGVLCVVLYCHVNVAFCTPIVLTLDPFDDLKAGKTVTLEDFQSFTPGPQESPLVLNNGIATVTEPHISDGGSTGVRLLSGEPCVDPIVGCRNDFMVFNDFPEGTIAWSTRIWSVPLQGALGYDIQVIGGTGTLILNDVSSSSFRPFDFFAVADELGLIEVRIKRVNPFFSPHALFDIQTIAVPEPSGALLALLGIGFTVIAVNRRRFGSSSNVHLRDYDL